MVLWIALLLALYGLSALFAAPPSQTGLPAGTSFSAAPDGALAFFDLLAHPPGAGAVRVRLEPAALAHWSQTPKNLLIVEPQVDDSARTDAWWLRLARRGFHVVELTDRNTPLVTALGLKWHSPGASTPAHPAGPSGAGTPPARHAGAALPQGSVAATERLAYAPPVAPADGSRGASPGGSPVGSPGRTHGAQWLVRLPTPAPSLSHIARTDARWLISDPAGGWTVVGVTRNLGAGSITLLTLPSIVYNGTVGQANNLGPLLFLLQPWRYSTGFSETVHGYALVPGILPLLGPGAGYAAAVLAAALLLYVWSRGRRLGAITDFEPLAEPASLALASALARHYRQRKDYDALAEHVRAFLARRETAPTGRAAERPAGAHVPATRPAPAARLGPRAYLELVRAAVAARSGADRPRTAEPVETNGKEG